MTAVTRRTSPHSRTHRRLPGPGSRGRTRRTRFRFSAAIAASLASLALLSGSQAASDPHEAFVGLLEAFLGTRFVADWDGLENLPNVEWASARTMLESCRSDGGCFTREGTALLAGKALPVVASGARTMVFNLYLRNRSPPFGEAVVTALERAGVSAELARCPLRGGGTSWYRLRGANLSSAYLSIEPGTAAQPDEVLALSLGEKLPRLLPAELALYSEQCAPGAKREPVSVAMPHEQLAQTIVSVLLPAVGPAVYDWKALPDVAMEIVWDPTGPKPVDRTVLGDPNPVMQSGSLTHSGREFSVVAAGTAAEVKAISFEERGTHPRGEHLLGVVYAKGFSVRIVRCGPIYRESTHTWYRVTSARTLPAFVRQSIGYDGDLATDSYEVRLDGTLPSRDPRDRDPGTNGC